MSHCRVQSPGEINVMIVPHCRVEEFHPPYWKSFFTIFYFFLFLMQFKLWRAAAFVSSPIHLLNTLLQFLVFISTFARPVLKCSLPSDISQKNEYGISLGGYWRYLSSFFKDLIHRGYHTGGKSMTLAVLCQRRQKNPCRPIRHQQRRQVGTTIASLVSLWKDRADSSGPGHVDVDENA